MPRLLIVALDDSRARAGIAANVIRQLPRNRYTCAFITAPDLMTHVHDLGYPAMSLDRESASANRDAADRMVSTFRPDQILVADEPALARSIGWSGLDLASLRERHAVPLVCLDRYGRGATPVTVDGYGEPPHQLPGLADQCDLVLRCAPPYRAGEDGAGVALVGLTGGGLRAASAVTPPPDGPRQSAVPMVFISEPADAAAPSAPARALTEALPRILHHHLAALNRPLRIVHVGGRVWDFLVAPTLEYVHLAKLPPAAHREQMLAADLYLTANVASHALAEAALSGVPALVLHQPDELVLTGPDAHAPEWLTAAAPELTRVHPFRAYPWGWYQLLTQALRDNPYAGCFRGVALADREAFLSTASALLDDGATRLALYQRQLSFRDELAALPAVADVLSAVVAR